METSYQTYGFWNSCQTSRSKVTLSGFYRHTYYTYVHRTFISCILFLFLKHFIKIVKLWLGPNPCPLDSTGTLSICMYTGCCDCNVYILFLFLKHFWWRPCTSHTMSGKPVEISKIVSGSNSSDFIFIPITWVVFSNSLISVVQQCRNTITSIKN